MPGAKNLAPADRTTKPPVFYICLLSTFLKFLMYIIWLHFPPQLYILDFDHIINTVIRCIYLCIRLTDLYVK